MKRAIAKGMIWMLLLKLTERSVGFASVLILARILVPADFGVVAMAMSVIALIELASAFSFELAIIQREKPTRHHYDTAWTLQVAFGSACALATASLAHPAASFYNEPRLVPVMLVLAAGWLVQSFENIGLVDFRRRMEFNRDFFFLVSKKLVAFLATMSVALILRSYWALVAGMVAGRVTGVALSYVMHPYRPRWSLKARRDLFSFSAWVCVNSLVAFAGNRLSHFVVGRLHGSAALGLYTVGSEIASLPATDLVAPINRALFPGYARMTSDPGTLREGYLDVISMIGVAALPMSFGITAIAEPLVRVMLGEQWMGAVAFVQILGFAGAVHALGSNNHSIWLALGKSRTSALVELIYLVALIPLIVTLSKLFGLVGIACAELAGAIIGIAISYALISRDLHFSPRAYVGCLWRPLAAATAMAGTVAGLFSGVEHAGLAWVGVAIPLGAVTYFSVLLLLWVLVGTPRGAESLLVERVTILLASLRQGGAHG